MCAGPQTYSRLSLLVGETSAHPVIAGLAWESGITPQWGGFSSALRQSSGIRLFFRIPLQRNLSRSFGNGPTSEAIPHSPFSRTFLKAPCICHRRVTSAL